MMTRPEHGVALVCDARGHVAQILHDDLGLPAALVGRPLGALFSPATRAGCLRFMTELRQQGVCFDRSLSLDGAQELFFSGISIGETLLVCATRTSTGVTAMFARMTETNNELMTELRTALKRASDAERGCMPAADVDYERMMLLNNELANMQREMSRKNSELAALNAKKNEFLGMAAHDLRNPLSVVTAYSACLLDDADAFSPEHRTFIEAMRDSAAFMLDLVDDFLDLSAIESGSLRLRRSWIEPRDLVERNVRTNAELARRKGTRVVGRFEADLPRLFADAGKLAQVLNNLISNAVKYSPAGSEVEVRVGHDAEALRIEVADPGPGIPEDAQAYLFDAFATTANRTTGGEKSTGLGLAIVAQIVRGHGGRMEVDSRPGAGTTMRVVLPLDAEAPAADGPAEPAAEAQDEPSTDRAARAEAAAPDASPLRVLIVEDDAFVRDMTRCLVEAQGHRTVCVGDGRSALEALRSDAFDVLLLDTELPDLSGHDVARHARADEAGRSALIVSLSGHDSQAQREAARQAGVDLCLSKSDLHASLAGVFDRARRAA